VSVPELARLDNGVYSPVELICPHGEPPQPVPFTVHVTDVLAAFKTTAVNCCDWPTGRSRVEGEIDTATGGSIVSWTEDDLDESASAVAAITTVAGVGRARGAV